MVFCAILYSMKYQPTIIKKWELLRVFPEAKKIVKKQIKDCEQEIERLVERKREIRNKAFATDQEERVTEILLDGVDDLIESYNKEINNKQVMLMSSQKKNDTLEVNVERAKEFPIDSLIEFQNNKACCVFHDERTPSLHYYKNTNSVYCWGCHKYGDSIEVAMALWGVDFKTAVEKLSS